MLTAPLPDNEAQRLDSLRKMLLLYTPDEEVFDRITRMAKRVFGVPIVLLTLLDEERQWFKSRIGVSVRETPRAVSFCGHAIVHDATFVVTDAQLDPRFADNPLVTGPPLIRFYAGRPVKNPDGFAVGTLCLIDHQPRPWTPDDDACLNDLAHWVEQAFLTRQLGESQLQMLQQLDEAKRHAMLDPMLNVWHRGAQLQLLEQELVRAARQRSTVGLLMLDLDHFKRINDSYGHPAGDEVLATFVHRVRAQLRPYDVLGRYGGDEFMVVLPGADLAAASDKAKAILDAVRATPVRFGAHEITMSASIGVAIYPESAGETPSATALIERADQALLAVKRHGRGQARAYGDTRHGEPVEP